MWLYLAQLIVAIFTGIAIYNLLDEVLDASAAVDILINGFDRTIISDLINTNSTLGSRYISIMITSIMTYLILSVYLHACILVNIDRKSPSQWNMMRQGVKYIIPHIIIVSCSLLVLCILLSCIWIPFIKITDPPLETFDSEKPYFIWIMALVILSICLMIVIWAWSVIMRLRIIRGYRLKESLQHAVSMLAARWPLYLCLGISLVVVSATISLLYLNVTSNWAVTSWMLVVILIIIQQCVSIGRVVLKVFGYVAIDHITKESK